MQLPRAYLSSGNPKGRQRGVTAARLKGLIMKEAILEGECLALRCEFERRREVPVWNHRGGENMHEGGFGAGAASGWSRWLSATSRFAEW